MSKEKTEVTVDRILSSKNGRWPVFIKPVSYTHLDVYKRQANDMTTSTITTHFDYHSIDHNLLKLDILGHDDPTMIRTLEDMTDLNAREVPLDDKAVMSLFASTEALGIMISNRIR